MTSDIPGYPTAPDGRPLVWGRIRWKLRFDALKAGKAHPWFVLRSILLHGLKEDAEWTRPPFTWHLLGRPVPPRFSANDSFEIAMIVPADRAEETCERLAKNLARRPPDHFSSLEPPDMEWRTLAALFEENPFPAEDIPIDSHHRGILELDFLSPWAFKAAEARESWRALPETLTSALMRSAAPFLGFSLPPPPGDWPEIHLDSRFWHLIKLEQTSRGQPGRKQWISGFRGPLYVRAALGDLRRIWAWLLLGAEFHLGPGRPLGQGCYLPSPPRNRYDAALSEIDRWQTAWSEWIEKRDPHDPPAPLAAPGCENDALVSLAGTVARGEWRPAPVVEISVPKNIRVDDGGSDALRPLGLLAPSDQMVHRVLHHLLAPSIERVLSPSAIGFRKGRSVDTARRRIHHAFRSGLRWVAESDIARFFDDIPLTSLSRLLDDLLPPGNPVLRGTLEAALRTPVARDGQVRARGERGLVQGSPLSPMLSNLYLVSFDARMEETGATYLRYGDDFLLLGETREAVESALSMAGEILRPLGLELKPEKTAVHDAGAATFRFLGMEFGAAPPPADRIEEAEAARLLQRPLYLRAPYRWAGCEEGSITLREGTSLVGRAPLVRVSEIVAEGLGGFSLHLLESCRKERIPLTLCTVRGEVVATLFPDTQASESRLVAHHHRHAALGDSGLLAAARQVVAAKLDAYLHWLHDIPHADTRRLARDLRGILGRLDEAPDIPALMGHEGSASRLLYPFINRRLLNPDFHSARRTPRERTDLWNVLLDIGYHLLFTRIHAHLRSQGLSPYLGFLHSAANRYPSLVCDLQEPYRARIDRFLSRLVNRREVTASDFERMPDGRWRLHPSASPRVVEAFEAEMDSRLAGQDATARRLIALHCLFLRRWVEGSSSLALRFFETGKSKRKDGKMS